jgi:DNA-binding NtrC family response regulator
MSSILLVDDDQNFRRSLVIQLEFEGHRVKEAENASHALAYLEKCESNGNFPDIVITDMKMPGMNGGDFVWYLRETYPELRVMIISAFELPERLCGYQFLRKPFKIQQMLSIMNETFKSDSL